MLLLKNNKLWGSNSNWFVTGCITPTHHFPKTTCHIMFYFFFTLLFTTTCRYAVTLTRIKLKDKLMYLKCSLVQ